MDKPAEGVNVTKEPFTLLSCRSVRAQNYHRLPQAHTHCDLCVLSKTVPVTGEVNHGFGAFDHQALDQPLIFMALGSAHRWIKVSKTKSLKARMREDVLAVRRHVSEVVPLSHTGGDIDVELVHD